MKKLTILLIIGFMASSVLIASAATGPEVIKMKAKMGEITFHHAQHQSKIENCTECHHKGLETPKCTSCHGVKDGVPTAKKAFHGQCKACHKKSGGPVKCKDCHVK